MIGLPGQTGPGARPLFLPDEFLRAFAPAPAVSAESAMVAEVNVVQVIRAVSDRDRLGGSVLAPLNPTGVGSGTSRDRA